MEENIGRILICPNCGADCSHISPTDLEHNVCEHCGHELYDHSVEIFDEKKEYVTEKKKEMKKTIPMVAIIVGITFFILFALAMAFYALHLDTVFQNFMWTKDGNKMTKKMERLYEKEDWDGLYEVIILDVENAIESPYYFTYRTAWFLNTYPAEFDACIESGDMNRANEIYKTIKEDYNMRTEDFKRLYELKPDIEKGLQEEYERETAIMEKQNQ